MVVASAVALAEAVPDASLRPAGFALERGAEVDLDEVGELLVEAGYERIDQVEERGQFAIRGGILDVFGATEDRAARVELFGDEIESIRWFSTFTQRSLGEPEQVELVARGRAGRGAPRAAPSSALEEATEPSAPDLAELLPLDRFRAAAGPDPRRDRVIVAAAEEIQAALRDHWDDVTTAMHDADARRLYVDVAEPLAERAAMSVSATRLRTGALVPRPGAELGGAQHRRGGGAARARASLRLPRRRRVRAPRRGRAGPLQPEPRSSARFLRRRPAACAARSERRCCSPRRRSPTASSRPS